jgi:hypothetical protein
MHPAISRWPGKHFYSDPSGPGESLLKDAPSTHGDHHAAARMAFYQVAEMEKQGKEPSSMVMINVPKVGGWGQFCSPPVAQKKRRRHARHR